LRPAVDLAPPAARGVAAAAMRFSVALSATIGANGVAVLKLD